METGSYNVFFLPRLLLWYPWFPVSWCPPTRDLLLLTCPLFVFFFFFVRDLSLSKLTSNCGLVGSPSFPFFHAVICVPDRRGPAILPNKNSKKKPHPPPNHPNTPSPTTNPPHPNSNPPQTKNIPPHNPPRNKQTNRPPPPPHQPKKPPQPPPPKKNPPNTNPTPHKENPTQKTPPPPTPNQPKPPPPPKTPPPKNNFFFSPEDFVQRCPNLPTRSYSRAFPYFPPFLSPSPPCTPLQFNLPPWAIQRMVLVNKFPILEFLLAPF